MNWGKSIILAFVLFGAFIATLVTVCMRQDVSLVTKEYYKDELNFQNQIDRMAHTALLSEKPSVKVDSGDLLKVTYNEFNKVEEGALQLFRPSDPSMDKKFILRQSEASSQYFSTIGMEKGMYRARITWTLASQEFYLEQVITL